METQPYYTATWLADEKPVMQLRGRDVDGLYEQVWAIRNASWFGAGRPTKVRLASVYRGDSWIVDVLPLEVR